MRHSAGGLKSADTPDSGMFFYGPVAAYSISFRFCLIIILKSYRFRLLEKKVGTIYMEFFQPEHIVTKSEEISTQCIPSDFYLMKKKLK